MQTKRPPALESSYLPNGVWVWQLIWQLYGGWLPKNHHIDVYLYWLELDWYEFAGFLHSCLPSIEALLVQYELAYINNTFIGMSLLKVSPIKLKPVKVQVPITNRTLRPSIVWHAATWTGSHDRCAPDQSPRTGRHPVSPTPRTAMR